MGLAEWAVTPFVARDFYPRQQVVTTPFSSSLLLSRYMVSKGRSEVLPTYWIPRHLKVVYQIEIRVDLFQLAFEPILT